MAKKQECQNCNHSQPTGSELDRCRTGFRYVFCNRYPKQVRVKAAYRCGEYVALKAPAKPKPKAK